MGTKSQTTSSKTVYGDTTTSNPYAYARTNNSGTISNFQDGTALNSVYNFVNRNINSLLDDYLTPNLNSTTNQAKLNSFRNNLNSESYRSFENNIINPLSRRNMIRSSQATDLYRNLADRNNASIENYITDLISQAQDSSAKMLSNLLSYYMQGADYLSDMQKQSLNTSSGNSTKTTETNGGGSQNSLQQILRLALMAASGL